MDIERYVRAVDAESARCLEALRSADLGRTVPSCPDWDGADLAWHLAGVQHHWATVVDRLVEDPAEVEGLTRPTDEDLLDLLADRSAALVTALRERSPDDRCWTWHPDGDTVGWVARRQAHEALIHRVDAELVAGSGVTVPDPELAADGVDEVLRVMVDGSLPPWAEFIPDGATLAIEPADATGRWALEFGRFTGTSPASGNTYDLDDARVIDVAAADAVVTAPAWDLDLWLWGRGGEDALEVTGDRSLPPRLRSIAVESTQ